jgi:hypothetical protein
LIRRRRAPRSSAVTRTVAVGPSWRSTTRSPALARQGNGAAARRPRSRRARRLRCRAAARARRARARGGAREDRCQHEERAPESEDGQQHEGAGERPRRRPRCSRQRPASARRGARDHRARDRAAGARSPRTARARRAAPGSLPP